LPHSSPPIDWFKMNNLHDLAGRDDRFRFRLMMAPGGVASNRSGIRRWSREMCRFFSKKSWPRFCSSRGVADQRGNFRRRRALAWNL